MGIQRLKLRRLKQFLRIRVIGINREDLEKVSLINLMYNRGININVHTVHGGKK